MSNTWILVCDAAKARLFEASGPRGAWTETACYSNPELLGPPNKRGTGRTVPRVQESMGSARHVIEPHTNPKDRSAKLFAQHIAAELHKAKAQRRYGRLFLVAPPRFLGVLREQIGDQEAAGVMGALDNDVVSLPTSDLIEHVRRAFPRNFIDEPIRQNV